MNRSASVAGTARNRNLDRTFRIELLDRAVLEGASNSPATSTTTPVRQKYRSATCRRRQHQAVEELSNYDWRSAQAREGLREIRDLLGRGFARPAVRQG